MSVNGANQVITAKFTAIQALEKAGDKKGAEALRQQLLDFGFTKDQIDEGIFELRQRSRRDGRTTSSPWSSKPGSSRRSLSDETTITKPNNKHQ